MSSPPPQKLGCGLIFLIGLVGIMALGALIQMIDKIFTHQAPPASAPADPSPAPAPSAPPRAASPPLSPGMKKAAEEAALKLYAMQAKGLIQLSIAEPSTFLLVEPLAWRGLTHRDKQKLILMAGTFAHGLNAQGKNILFVICQDLTSRKTLARYSLRDKHLEIIR